MRLYFNRHVRSYADNRLVLHAEVVALKGDSYRLRNRDLGRVPATGTEDQ